MDDSIGCLGGIFMELTILREWLHDLYSIVLFSDSYCVEYGFYAQEVFA